MPASSLPSKIGLALSGGGAKGAYQLGVFHALNELRLLPRIRAVSGCSIGALNALLFASGDPARGDAAWSSVGYSRFLVTDDEAKLPQVKELIHALSRREENISPVNIIRSYNLGVFSQRGLAELLYDYADFGAVQNSSVDYFACCYNTRDYRPEYFRLNDLPREEMVDAALASAAIPFLYNPVRINGIAYADGGINSPLYPSANADKIPVTPLAGLDCDLILVVYLSQGDRADLSVLPEGMPVIELYPSQPLEPAKGAGTLDLSRRSLAERYSLGYRDTLVTLAPVFAGLLGGGDLAGLIAAQRGRSANPFDA